MEMEEQYGLPDLRHLMGARTHFPAKPQVAVQFSSQRDLTRRVNHYNEMIMGDHRQVTGEMFPGAVLDFGPNSTTSTSAATSALCGLEMAEASIGVDGGNGRWPRQETLTLLDIRSRLDPNFKEANQKGPLWDEISRIMAEEYGYQRSGKKCREKFENLYKYYKKTKDGKGGRQDGKHYRFFRQLEALYGETTTPTTTNNLTPLSPSRTQTQTHLAPQSSPQVNQRTQRGSQAQQKQWESLSLSSSSDLDSSSPEEKSESESHHKRRRKSWKAKIRDFVDSQMRRLVETQGAWMEKISKTLERKEQERMSREEAWRKEEAARLDREFKFWAHERAWVEARDAAVMEVLQKFTRREPKVSASSKELVATTQDNSENQNENGSETLEDSCKECNNGCRENLGNKALLRRQLDHLPYRQGSEEQGGETMGLQFQTSDALSPKSNLCNAVSDSCFRYLMAEEEPLWENYDVKLHKGENPLDRSLRSVPSKWTLEASWWMKVIEKQVDIAEKHRPKWW